MGVCVWTVHAAFIHSSETRDGKVPGNMRSTTKPGIAVRQGEIISGKALTV